MRLHPNLILAGPSGGPHFSRGRSGCSGRSGEVRVADLRVHRLSPPPDSRLLRAARDKRFQEVLRQDPELPSRHVSWEDRGWAAV